MPDRDKVIEKALKLLRLAEENDHLIDNREGERSAAREKLKAYCSKYHILPIEIVLERPIDIDKVNQLYQTYGTYFDYIMLLDDFRSYWYVKPVNPYYNSYYIGPDFNFVPVTRPDVKTRNELERETSQFLSFNFHGSRIENIKNLNLSNQPFRSLKGLENFTHLKFLNLKGCPVKSLRQVEYLEDLIVLNLKDTKVKSIKELSNLRNLRVVNLKGTKVMDLKPLNNCPQLEMVIADKNVRKTFKKKGVLVI